MFDYMPEQGSHWAREVDWINGFITDVSVISTVSITLVALYFAYKYRRRSPDQEGTPITHNVTLETVWTVIPAVIAGFTFYLGLNSYREMRTPPANALEINVDAHSWRWEFEHPNGKKDTDKLVVPIGGPVRLIMTSHDVLHSFFIPAMRVKEDVRGNVYSYLWFTPVRLGTYPVFCAEYCGFDHSGMMASLEVVTPEAYQDYIADRGPAVELSPQEVGKEAFAKKACNACHTIDGTKGQGPTLKGIFQSGTRTLEDGSQATVDENYVRESLLNPQAKIVQGFTGVVMPSFQGQLSEKELSGIIAYLKSL